MPEVCRWCNRPIVQDGRGGWVHTARGSYACRDRFNVLLPTSAAPQPGGRWTSLYGSGGTPS
jgi:hypothetical protein